MTECQRQYAEVEESINNNGVLLGGPEHPECMEDGSFAPRQCKGSTGYCWCVDTETGEILEGTETRGSLECEGK